MARKAGAGLRRRQRRPGRGRAAPTAGSASIDLEVFVADLPPGLDPGGRGRRRPGAAGGGGREGDAVPAVPARPGVRGRGPRQQRGARGPPSGRSRSWPAHRPELVRDQYLMDVARAAGSSPTGFRTLLEQVQAPPPRPASPGGRRPPPRRRRPQRRGRRADEPPPPGDERSWAGGTGGVRTVENRPDHGDGGSGAAPGALAWPGAGPPRPGAPGRPGAGGAAPRRPRPRGRRALAGPELFDDDVHRGPIRPCSTPTPMPTRSPRRPRGGRPARPAAGRRARLRALRRGPPTAHEAARRHIAAALEGARDVTPRRRWDLLADRIVDGLRSVKRRPTRPTGC